MSSPSPAAARGGGGGGGGRNSQLGLRPNPTPSERRRQAAEAAAGPHASPNNTRAKTTPQATKTPAKSNKETSKSPKPTGKSPKETTKQAANDGLAPREVERGEEEEGEAQRQPQRLLEEKLAKLEKRMEVLEEEKEKMGAAMNDLRDRIEEGEWARRQLEQKIVELTDKGENGSRAGSLETSEAEKKVKEVEEKIEESMRELKKMEEKMGERMKKLEERDKKDDGQTEGGGGGGEVEGGDRNQRYIILTDSNGKGAMSHSVKNHIPRDKWASVKVEVVVAFTLDEAYRLVDRGNIDVREAVVIIDDLTNDARGTHTRPAVIPTQLIRMVDRLRRRLMAAGARNTVVCQIKPMQVTNVIPFNDALDAYLREEKAKGRGGFGCQTQIRLSYLRNDGYHVKPQYDSVVDKTYACAIMGTQVPDPTPGGAFMPDLARRRWETEWPAAGSGRHSDDHGWRW